MNRLKLINFKAHTALEIPFNEKNFLLYGDNGAGKSSIYEALKLIFYNERLERAVKQQFTEEQQEEKIKEFYREFDNKSSPIQDFEIKINDTDYSNFPSADYQVYMLNLEDISFAETLKLNELLKKVFFCLSSNPENNFQEIQNKTNAFLESCLEDIKIEIDSSDDYAIKIKNEVQNIPNTKEIKKYFNEGKINLVILALLFSAIEVTKEVNKKNVLILDDFITSLDMANRTFLMRHILGTFADFQIVILTHNVYFYNLIMYLVNDIYKTKDKWQFANLYEIGNEHRVYIRDIDDTIIKLEEKYKPQEPSFNISEYGNQLRQKFERLLYELSKILMVGGVEESNKILDGIANQKIYFNYIDGKDSSDLIEGIEQIIQTSGTKEAIVGQIKTQINRYKILALDEIRQTLNTLKLYRKVSMHSLSHGQTGQHNWSDKEIKQTLILLKKLESNIKSLTDNSVN